MVLFPVNMKPKKMCDEAVDDCLKALKFAPDWFATSKMLERSDDALNANDDLLFFDKDFSKLTFFANQMDILGVDFDKINLDEDNNFYEDDSDTIIYVIFLTWHNKFEKH